MNILNKKFHCRFMQCLAITGLALGMLAGVQTTASAFVQKTISNDKKETAPLLVASYNAGDALASILDDRFSKGSPILVANLVDLNNLEETSAFGRLAMQQIASRLGQYGYTLTDIRLRKNMALIDDIEPNSGEFLLSRNAAELGNSYKAKAALVGTFSQLNGRLFISVRVIQLKDNSILAAHEYVVPLAGTMQQSMSGVSAEAWQEHVMRPNGLNGLSSLSMSGTSTEVKDPAALPKQAPLAPAPKR